ncbi:hypothetical protein KRP22_001299 [Phytophthora ramorum]|nr:hypothetical protein KRP22_7293 [Phytophthora ramorum]
MSLENAPTLADCLSVPSSEAASNVEVAVPDADEATLEGALADRFQVWTKVAEVIERLTPVDAYQGDVHALRKLQQLHLLCKQRETHLRALQLTLLQEGRSAPRVQAAPPISPTETAHSDNKYDNEIDGRNANQPERKEEQERHMDFVDYDAMDLIELSEQFS